MPLLSHLARLCVCACCCYCVRVVRLGGQVGLGLAIEGLERIQRAKPLAFPSSYVAPKYLRKFCISSLGQVGFYNSQFYKIFCHSIDSFGQIISNKTTNYKFQKNQRYFKIYFKYIYVYFRQEILILHIEGPKKKYIYALRSKICPIINIKIYFSTTLFRRLQMCRLLQKSLQLWRNYKKT